MGGVLPLDTKDQQPTFIIGCVRIAAIVVGKTVASSLNVQRNEPVKVKGHDPAPSYSPSSLNIHIIL
jgi:hypothetical protein